MSKDIIDAFVFTSHTWFSQEIEDIYGQLRGGASPIKIAGKMYYVIQSNVKSSLGCIYTCLLYTSDAADE